MRLRLMGLEDELIDFAKNLDDLERAGKIEIVFISKPYLNSNRTEYRVYCEFELKRGANKC